MSTNRIQDTEGFQQSYKLVPEVCVLTAIGLLNAGSSLVEVVSFLLELAFRPMSQPGLIKELNSVQCGVANHMAQLGVMKLFRVRINIENTIFEASNILLFVSLRPTPNL